MGFLVSSNLRNMRLTLLYELIDVFSRCLNRCEKLLLKLLYQNCLFPVRVFICIFKLDGQENATLQFSQIIGFFLWMKPLMFLQVTWTWVAFSTCYTTEWFISSVFSHVPKHHRRIDKFDEGFKAPLCCCWFKTTHKVGRHIQSERVKEEKE